MELFLKACGAVLLAVILILALGSKGRDMGLLISMAVCCMVGMLIAEYLRPVVKFLWDMVAIGGLNSSLMSVLLKAAGIGLLSELASLICQDSGNASLGKGILLLGSVVILQLSLPLFSELLTLLQRILGEI